MLEAAGDVEDDLDLEIPADQAFDDLLSALDEGEPEDVTAFINHPLYRRYAPGGDPNEWQRDFTRQIQAISANADQLATLAATIRGTHESRTLDVVVAHGGHVESLTFHAPATTLPTDRLAEEVMAAWSAATEAAKTAFDTAVADLGLPPGGAG